MINSIIGESAIHHTDNFRCITGPLVLSALHIQRFKNSKDKITHRRDKTKQDINASKQAILVALTADSSLSYTHNLDKTLDKTHLTDESTLRIVITACPKGHPNSNI